MIHTQVKGFTIYQGLQVYCIDTGIVFTPIL